MHSRSDQRYDIKECVNYMEELNFKLVNCVITNNKEISLKNRLMYHLIEFRSLKEDTDYYGYDEMLINRIGSLTSRLLRRGINITDEVALQCYDIREKEILNRQD